MAQIIDLRKARHAVHSKQAHKGNVKRRIHRPSLLSMIPSEALLITALVVAVPLLVAIVAAVSGSLFHLSALGWIAGSVWTLGSLFLLLWLIQRALFRGGKNQWRQGKRPTR